MPHSWGKSNLMLNFSKEDNMVRPFKTITIVNKQDLS